MDRYGIYRISAGFPSPAELWRERPLDVRDLLLLHPGASHMLRVGHHSMSYAQIHEGDVLIVDRLIEAGDNDIIVTTTRQGFTVERLQVTEHAMLLQAGHARVPTLSFSRQVPFRVWGVVLFRVRSHHPRVAFRWKRYFYALDELLMPHSAATFLVKVDGDSMIGAGIAHGDVLVVDRAVTATHKSIIVAALDQQFALKRLHLQQGKVTLLSEHPQYRAIPVTPDLPFSVWGVVIFSLHPLHPLAVARLHRTAETS